MNITNEQTQEVNLPVSSAAESLMTKFSNPQKFRQGDCFCVLVSSYSFFAVLSNKGVFLTIVHLPWKRGVILGVA